MNPTFEQVQAAHGTYWTAGKYFITRYEPSDAPVYFQAYRAVAPLKAGRRPWTVDNRRLGNEKHGFKTMADAEAACREHMGAEVAA